MTKGTYIFKLFLQFLSKLMKSRKTFFKPFRKISVEWAFSKVAGCMIIDFTINILPKINDLFFLNLYFTSFSSKFKYIALNVYLCNALK